MPTAEPYDQDHDRTVYDEVDDNLAELLELHPAGLDADERRRLAHDRLLAAHRHLEADLNAPDDIRLSGNLGALIALEALGAFTGTILGGLLTATWLGALLGGLAGASLALLAGAWSLAR